ncbi:hypothetical protein BJ138DRAFT_1094835 [Hygrophoropsis aurantiaca]|uniref:Uncharacterized protein n=1 Tax=Hygrophoropsis aurantiaca TaxID=72124 RepID=A0ACB7ZY01_9AGAM|nr:hypothetical protein BJ138DRAFT_1094835 [Hygrophoropsis aurantiaca]
MVDCLARIYFLFYLFEAGFLGTWAQQNVVVQSTSPDIVYSPALCNSSAIDTGCVSAWQLANDVPGTTMVATYGPVSQAGNTIPQLFLSFRASALYLRTSPFSNATVNFTLTASPSELTITRTVNTSIENIIAVDIPETQTTTLGVTFLPDEAPTRFDVESITLTVANSSATASYLPSLTLPPSSTPPTLSPSTSGYSSKMGGGQTAGTIAGETVGAVVGVFAVALVGAIIYRQRRQKRALEDRSR